MTGKLAKLSFAPLAVLIAYAFYTGGIWTSVSDFFDTEHTYTQIREERGFGRIPIGAIARKIDELVDAKTQFTLSGELYTNDFLKQRFIEGLYPRVLSNKASQRLQLLPREQAMQTPDRVLADFGNSLLVAEGIVPGKTEPRLTFDFAPLSYLLALLGMLGLGLWIALVPGFPISLALPFATLTSAALTGIAYSLALWLEFAIPKGTLPVLGLLLGTGTSFLLSKKKKLRSIFQIPRCKWTLGAGLAILLCLCVNPVWLWDGRSIWLFHAKQIFFNGVFNREEIFLEAWNWAHPEYPALFPAWLAQFSMFSSQFNERSAALGIWPLSFSLLLLVRYYLEKRVGEWGALGLLLVFLGGTWTLAVNAYVDPFVALSVLLFSLLLFEESPRTGLLAFLTALVAAQLKIEGAVFAGVALISSRKRLFTLAAFVPAAIHIAWGRAVYLKSDFDGVNFERILDNLGERVSTLVASFWTMLFSTGYTRCNSMALAAIVALLAAAALSIKNRFQNRAATSALLSACVMIGFNFFLMTITPRDQVNHIFTALDRLMITPSILAIFAVISIISDCPRKTHPLP